MENITEKVNSLTNWSLKDNYIEREIKFPTFQDALQAMLKIGVVCDEMNHHPDWSNTYNRLHIKLSTHDAGAVTDLDIQLAKRINELID